MAGPEFHDELFSTRVPILLSHQVFNDLHVTSFFPPPIEDQT